MSRPDCLIKILQKRERVCYKIRREHQDLGFNVDFKTNAMRIIREHICDYVKNITIVMTSTHFMTDNNIQSSLSSRYFISD